MWKVTRQRQMAQFSNMDAGREQGIDGHGAHSVTPEQVCFSVILKMNHIK